jgi:hypothetical protein
MVKLLMHLLLLIICEVLSLLGSLFGFYCDKFAQFLLAIHQEPGIITHGTGFSGSAFHWLAKLRQLFINDISRNFTRQLAEPRSVDGASTGASSRLPDSRGLKTNLLLAGTGWCYWKRIGNYFIGKEMSGVWGLAPRHSPD